MKKFIPTPSYDRVLPIPMDTDPVAELAIPLSEMLVLQRNGEAVTLTPMGIRSYDDPECDEIDPLSSLESDRLDYMQHLSKLERKARNAASKEKKNPSPESGSEEPSTDSTQESAESSD